jgi:cytidine deaminase
MQQFSFPYELSLKTQMPIATQRLLDVADHAAIQAITPDSGISTGAALILTYGAIISGAGQQVNGRGGTICAEQVLLRKLDPEGPAKVRAIAVTYRQESPDGQPLLPCGACRQSILELQRRQKQPISVYICAPDGEVILVEDAGYLLPFYAGTRNL